MIGCCLFVYTCVHKGGAIVTKSDLKTVGVREFRERLSEHLMSESPIAVTKHGLTVGYYIPTPPPDQ